ncbi:MAG: FlgD immunoglobulin-like domain containing protein, partial [Fidelibacterota bacterium]
PEQAFVTLVVYDLLGREVKRLVNEQMEAGYQQVMWNGRDSRGKEVPTGIYIARMDAGDYTKSIKMLLMK